MTGLLNNPKSSEIGSFRRTILVLTRAKIETHTTVFAGSSVWELQAALMRKLFWRNKKNCYRTGRKPHIKVHNNENRVQEENGPFPTILG